MTKRAGFFSPLFIRIKFSSPFFPRHNRFSGNANEFHLRRSAFTGAARDGCPRPSYPFRVLLDTARYYQKMVRSPTDVFPVRCRAIIRFRGRLPAAYIIDIRVSPGYRPVFAPLRTQRRFCPIVYRLPGVRSDTCFRR